MLKGKGVSSGIGFGNVLIINKKENKIEKKIIQDIDEEVKRVKIAFKEIKDETKHLIQTITGTEKEIMETYLLIIQDETLINEVENSIKSLGYNAEYAVQLGFGKTIQTLKNIDDEYLSSRWKDIKDIENKILSKLMNEKTINLGELEPNTIIVAKELTTSDTAKLDFKNVVGIITEIGGTNSHSSIMARTHEIPSVTRVQDVTKVLRNGDFVAINGENGEIYLKITQEEKERLIKIKENIEKEKNELNKYKNKQTTTKDNVKFELAANIGTPEDIDLAIDNTSEGIGLFRSEFLYMNKDEMPSEEQQFESYKQVAKKMNGKRVIIRTLDIGGDKELKYLNLEKEDNPFLGYRAIRLCLDNILLFKNQLRAILRASVYGNLAIMFPMISSLEELREAKKILEECKKELLLEKQKIDSNIKVGIMIEIPSAVLIANQLAKECDFFSIGTNDLIQYTIAVERGNEKVAKLYNKYHPAVIKLIKETIVSAHNLNIFCGMCGEAASDRFLIPLLVGFGLDEFSMNSNKILKARSIICNLNKKQCEELSREIIELSTAKEVEEKLKEFYINNVEQLVY